MYQHIPSFAVLPFSVLSLPHWCFYKRRMEEQSQIEQPWFIFLPNNRIYHQFSMLAFTIALDGTSLTRNDVTVDKSNEKHLQICPLPKNPNFSMCFNWRISLSVVEWMLNVYWKCSSKFVYCTRKAWNWTQIYKNNLKVWNMLRQILL